MCAQKYSADTTFEYGNSAYSCLEEMDQSEYSWNTQFEFFYLLTLR